MKPASGEEISSSLLTCCLCILQLMFVVIFSDRVLTSTFGRQPSGKTRVCIIWEALGPSWPTVHKEIFTAARKWNQSSFPQTDKWIMKMWYMHTIELHPTVKKNEVMKFVAKWIKLGKKLHWVRLPRLKKLNVECSLLSYEGCKQFLLVIP